MIETFLHGLALALDIRRAVRLVGAFDQLIEMRRRHIARAFVIERYIFIKHLTDGVIKGRAAVHGR